MKKIVFLILLIISYLISFPRSKSIVSYAESTPNNETAESNTESLNLTSKAVVLIDGQTGRILYEKKKDQELIPASITKIMTLTLIFEAIDQGKITLNDEVSVSEYAASMGGSQVFLEPGETQTVDSMIKCISVASANDAAVAMAEKLEGSEDAFVKKMNEKAAALGMKHTKFKNCTGLDDSIESGHYSSAYDVALMSQELIQKHPEISNYSTLWMDSIVHKTKKGENTFQLTNTNKLVRFYDGITGLKTGSTSKAKYCLSATAKRNGVSLIAVIMAAPDHNIRFTEAQKLLDYGFSKCQTYEDTYEHESFSEMKVSKGRVSSIPFYPKSSFHYTFYDEYQKDDIKKKIEFTNQVAPIKKGDEIGFIAYEYQGNPLGKVPLLALKDCEQASFIDTLLLTIQSFFL